MARGRRKREYRSYNVDEVKAAARGRWIEILETVGGIPADLLTGEHVHCPKCGGKDRFRFSNRDDDGGLICNKCYRPGSGDGLSTLTWYTGRKFAEVLQMVADHLGIQPTAQQRPAAARKQQKADPAAGLVAKRWNEMVIALWAHRKGAISPDAVRQVGSQIARYNRRFDVVDIPVIGQDGQVVGHSLYNLSGGTLPKATKDSTGKKKLEHLKVKLTYGSTSGLICCSLDQIRLAEVIWKVEGPSDLLALLTAGLPPGHAAMTNANGSGETPRDWMLELVTGKQVYVIHDRDLPGQEGAEKWAARLATTAAEVRNVQLPFELAQDHGQDLRDFFRAGGTVEQLLQLAAETERATPGGQEEEEAPPAAEQEILDPDGVKLIEAEDDPYRLARVNLEQYATASGGRTIAYWRGEWYVWKHDRYWKIEEDELRGKIGLAIKREFDRCYLERMQDPNRDPDEEPGYVRKVTRAIIFNVMQATACVVGMPASIELNSWIDDPVREKRNYISMKNGIVDLDAIMAGKPASECIRPHDHRWFSTIALPYEFDPNADCPLWEAFLERNLEMDPERIKILQEWAGYCLTPDTSYQKFMMLEGEGANGKSVYAAGLRAMLGDANCSAVQLEMFGDRFAKTSTLGKLLNVSADAGTIDKVAEGALKSFTSGDRMFFDRKNLQPIECVPTARMLICCNSRPRITDRSDGVYRRVIPIVFNVKIPENEQIIGMDKSEWWLMKKQCSGIFNWAVLGLARLRAQGRFTKSTLVEEAKEDYRCEMNPARVFLGDFLEDDPHGEVNSLRVYELYSKWCHRCGYMPLSERQFSKEVIRKFPGTKKSRAKFRTERFWKYHGVKFSATEILGESIDENTLF